MPNSQVLRRVTFPLPVEVHTKKTGLKTLICLLFRVHKWVETKELIGVDGDTWKCKTCTRCGFSEVLHRSKGETYKIRIEG
jgi:hypothetical protein